jgi:hypothetical protein
MFGSIPVAFGSGCAEMHVCETHGRSGGGGGELFYNSSKKNIYFF